MTKKSETDWAARIADGQKRLEALRADLASGMSETDAAHKNGFGTKANLNAKLAKYGREDRRQQSLSGDAMTTAYALYKDGDTEALPDGRVLRLRFEPDQDSSVNDYESDGRIEWTRRNDYGAVRPSAMDGSARVIDTEYPYSLWWMPPGKDIIGDTPWDDATMRREESRVRDLVRFGFQGIILEVLQGEDAYRRPIVVAEASLWGVEWDVDAAYLAEVVSDLVHALVLE